MIKQILRSIRNNMKWTIRNKYKRWWELRGFIGWMEKRHGIPKYGIASSLNWRRNEDGVLISLFLKTNILKVYHDGGKKTVNFFLNKKQDRTKAKKYLKL